MLGYVPALVLAALIYCNKVYGFSSLQNLLTKSSRRTHLYLGSQNAPRDYVRVRQEIQSLFSGNLPIQIDSNTRKARIFMITLTWFFSMACSPSFSADPAELKTQLESFQEEYESSALKVAREPKNLMRKLNIKLKSPSKSISTPNEKEIEDSMQRVLVLQAYLDEAERDLFAKDWENLQVYIYTFAEQENAFATLIQQLFPNNDELDAAAREALSFEAKSMFLYLDDLREAAKDHSFKLAQSAYAKLLLSYDRFLKAGGLYPTYDPITSTEVFFRGTPLETLRFDKTSRVQVLDQVVLISGPDMGESACAFLQASSHFINPNLLY